MIRTVFITILVLLFVCSGIAYSNTNSTVDNSETIKVEDSDGTSIIVTGDGDNVIHYNSPAEKDEDGSSSGVIIQQNDGMEAFVVVMSFPVFENDGMKNTFTELIIPLYYDGSWELLWVEE